MGEGLAPWERGREKTPDPVVPEEKHITAPDAEAPDAEAPVLPVRPPSTARFAPWLRGRNEDAGGPQDSEEEAPLVHSTEAARGERDDSPVPEPPVKPPPAPEPPRRRPARKPPAAGKRQKQDAIFARMRPYKEPARGARRAGQIDFAGGRPSTRFRLECDEVGLMLKSGPSDQLRWGIFGVLGLGLMIALPLMGIGLASMFPGGTFSFTSVPSSLSLGCTLSVLVVFCMLPCIVALRRGVHLVIDTGPGRARYRGPSGDVEFPTDFVTGMRSESAFLCRSVCLQVRGRGLLFLFYSDNLEEVSRVRECLSVSIPALRGKRIF